MTKCFNIVSNVNISASGKRKKDQNTEQSTWEPWKESRVAWGCGERVGRPQGGEICWRSKVGVGEVGELGPRKEGWRRVGHLTGGGHPLSQSTSVTVPTHTTTLYHTQCLAEARVEWELVFGAGELVELLAAGRDTHWTSCATSQTPPRRRRHLKPLISYTFQQILEGIFRRGEVCVDLGGFLRRVLLSKRLKFSFVEFCHLDSGDQLVAAGGDLPPACFLGRPDY